MSLAGWGGRHYITLRFTDTGNVLRSSSAQAPPLVAFSLSLSLHLTLLHLLSSLYFFSLPYTFTSAHSLTASVNAKGDTPLHCAVMRGSKLCARILIEKEPKTLEMFNSLFLSPFQLALLYKQFECFEVLLKGSC